MELGRYLLVILPGVNIIMDGRRSELCTDPGKLAQSVHHGVGLVGRVVYTSTGTILHGLHLNPTCQRYSAAV